MSYDITGKVKVLREPQVFDSGFTKREVVITVEDGKYPQDVSIEFVQDSVSKLDGVGIGDDVKITFDVRGREYNDRYFNNLVGWKLEVTAKGSVAEESHPAEDPAGEIPF